MFGLPGSFSQPARQTSMPRGVGADLHLGEHRLHELEASRSGGRTARARSRSATDSSTQPWQIPTQPAATRVAPGVQRAHRDLEALADLAEHRVVGHEDVVERDRRGVGAVQAHLAVDRLRLEAGLVGVDEEAGEARGA